MKQITSTDDIKRLGTILSIWAHPDDESFTCGGIMNAAVSNGQKVVCITATKGEAGVQDESRWPAKQLAAIRAKELLKALKFIGVTDHHWLGYKDGQCNSVSSREAVNKIKALIKKYQPDTILTFGPDGMTGHSDHQTISKWATAAAKDMNVAVYYAVEEKQRYIKYMRQADKQFNIYFNIKKPPVQSAAKCDIAFRLARKNLDCKCNALKSMTSQTEALIENTPPDIFEAMLNPECFLLSSTK